MKLGDNRTEWQQSLASVAYGSHEFRIIIFYDRLLCKFVNRQKMIIKTSKRVYLVHHKCNSIAFSLLLKNMYYSTEENIVEYIDQAAEVNLQ